MCEEGVITAGSVRAADRWGVCVHSHLGVCVLDFIKDLETTTWSPEQQASFFILKSLKPSDNTTKNE